MSRMFANQVNVRDLFSNNSSVRGERDDSAIDSSSQSNSQLPYSQLDFPDSQDFGNSQHSQASQSPGKKFYQHYKSKRTMFSSSGAQGRPVMSSSTPHPQQIQAQKAKAKERDERDTLYTILGTVKDCAAEVKSAVSAIKENVQHNTSNTENKLQNYLKTIQECVERHSTEVLKAFESRESLTAELSSIKKEVTLKDEKIRSLELELSSAKMDQNKDLISEIENICTDQHKATQARMKQVCDTSERRLENQLKQQQQHQSNTKKTEQKWHKELLQATKDSFVVLDDKVVDELKDISGMLKHERDTSTLALQSHQKQWQDQVQCQYEEQIMEMKNRHSNEVEKLREEQQKLEEEYNAKKRNGGLKTPVICPNLSLETLLHKSQRNTPGVPRIYSRETRDSQPLDYYSGRLKYRNEETDNHIKYTDSTNAYKHSEEDRRMRLDNAWDEPRTSHFDHHPENRNTTQQMFSRNYDQRSNTLTMMKSPMVNGKSPWNAKALFSKEATLACHSPVATVLPQLQNRNVETRNENKHLVQKTYREDHGRQDNDYDCNETRNKSDPSCMAEKEEMYQATGTSIIENVATEKIAPKKNNKRKRKSCCYNKKKKQKVTKQKEQQVEETDVGCNVEFRKTVSRNFRAVSSNQNEMNARSNLFCPAPNARTCEEELASASKERDAVEELTGIMTRSSSARYLQAEQKKPGDEPTIQPRTYEKQRRDHLEESRDKSTVAAARDLYRFEDEEDDRSYYSYKQMQRDRMPMSSENTHMMQTYPRNTNTTQEAYPRNTNVPQEAYPRNTNATQEAYPRNTNATQETYPRNTNVPQEAYPRNTNVTQETYPRNTNATQDAPNEKWNVACSYQPQPRPAWNRYNQADSSAALQPCSPQSPSQESEVSCQDSSPSLSVTEVFIKRRPKNPDTRSPTRGNGRQNARDYPVSPVPGKRPPFRLLHSAFEGIASPHTASLLDDNYNSNCQRATRLRASTDDNGLLTTEVMSVTRQVKHIRP